MRVINGKYQGKRIFPPKKFPSRPTTDMAKEGLFNILEARLYFEKLDVLDLFSGTGNISIEFLSRGVGKVISVDSSFVSWKFQQKVATDLKADNWHIIREKVDKYLENCSTKFDIVFADPPYDFEGVKEIPDLIFGKNLLVEDGLLIVEHSSRVSLSGLKRFKQKRDYGGVCFSFFE